MTANPEALLICLSLLVIRELSLGLVLNRQLTSVIDISDYYLITHPCLFNFYQQVDSYQRSNPKY